MATRTKHQNLDVDMLIDEGLLTRDPTSHPELLKPQKLGEMIEISDIPMEYHTEKENLMFCYVCGRTNHNFGFIAALQQGGFILVGNCCAGDISNQDLLILAKRKFSIRRNQYHYSVQAREIIEQLQSLLAICSTYEPICVQLDHDRQQFEDEDPNLIYSLRANIKQYGARLMSFELKANPQYKKNSSQPKLISVPVYLGTIKGTDFVTGAKRFDILRYEIEISLRSLIKIANDVTRAADSEKFVRRFRLEVRERAIGLDALLGEAIAFFEQSNLQTIKNWANHQGIRSGVVQAYKNAHKEKSDKTTDTNLQRPSYALPARNLTSGLVWGNHGGSNLIK